MLKGGFVVLCRLTHKVFVKSGPIVPPTLPHPHPTSSSLAIWVLSLFSEDDDAFDGSSSQGFNGCWFSVFYWSFGG
ncbi:unnamed protein product [Arabidopsis halleri]